MEEVEREEEDLYAVLEGSALIPFLESRLQSSSFLLEICKFELGDDTDCK